MGRVEQWHQNLMSYGMVPYLLTAVWFMHRVGDRNQPMDWEYLKGLFRAISPYYWASLGMYMAIGASITGAAWCAHESAPCGCTTAVCLHGTPFARNMQHFVLLW